MKEANGSFQVRRASIEDREEAHGFDGHINRNIRLAMALIDMAKPYLSVARVEELEGGRREITFTVNGCAWINEVSYSINGQQKQVQATTGNCNHVNEGQSQTEFQVTADPDDSLTLHAIVD